MNTYYEAFLRKDIFPNEPRKVDIVMDVYDNYEGERRYICEVIEDYIKGGSAYQAYKRLQFNIIDRYEYLKKKQSYLDKEYKESLL